MGEKPGLSRRTFLGSSATATATALLVRSSDANADVANSSTTVTETILSVNGREHRLVIDPRMTVLDTLRERLALTGSQKGCDHGQCGACTVLVDGHRVLSCLTLAIDVEGPITTIEGLASPKGDLHPMQQAFLDHDALQCGYCTPGQILSAVACVKEGHAGNEGEIREYMSGNLCRCAAYPNIVAAIKQAKRNMDEA